MASGDQSFFLSANQLGWVARDAAKASSEDGLQSLVAILFSCAYVEAALNELLHEIAAYDGPLTTLRPIARAAGLYERTASVRRKLQVLGVVASGKEVDFGALPFQDLDLLLELRNWLLHLRPEVLSVQENPDDEGASIINAEYHALIMRLKERKIIGIAKGQLLSVVDAARSPGVGTWSFRTAEAVFAELQRWFPSWRPPIMGTVQAVS